MKAVVFLVCLILSTNLNLTLICSQYKNYKLSSLQGSAPHEYDFEAEQLFNRAYDCFHSDTKELNAEDSIPKIIHFVWVGGKLPYTYNFCIESWKRHHPSWEIIIWDEDKISKFDIKNKKLFDKLNNFAAKADVLKLEILKKFGGVYVDIDFFCLQPIDAYTNRSTIFLGKVFDSIIGNGIIGASKNNEFIDLLIQKLSYFEKSIFKESKIEKSIDLTPSQIIEKVGPILVTNTLSEYIKIHGVNNILVLPPSYLHPFPNTLRDKFWDHTKSLVDIVKEYAYPETLAIHLWSVSWVKPRIDLHINPQPLCGALDSIGKNFVSIGSKNKDGSTPLHLAAQENNLLVVKNLILAGADVNSVDNFNNTPLMYAIKSGNIQNVKFLLKNGANTNIKNVQEQDAKDFAKQNKQLKIYKILSEINNPQQFIQEEPPLIKAVKDNQLKVAESLIRHGYSVNVCDKYGRTAIFYASINNNLDMGRLLILNGAYYSDSEVDIYGNNLKNYASSEFVESVIDNNQRKIIVVTCSYNNKQYYKQNLLSLFKQTYENWYCYYIDDNSQDGTFELAYEFAASLGMLHKIHFIKNNKRIGALENQYNVIHKCNDDDIIIIFDGDDEFHDNGVFRLINETYCDKNIWLTYGSYVPKISPFHVYCSDVCKKDIFKNNFFRNHPWVFSHLRTFYAGLFKKIKNNDLQINGIFFPTASDIAIMLPMLEMCGGKFKFISKPLLIYNNENPICDFKVEKSTKIPEYIRKLKPYNPIEKLF